MANVTALKKPKKTDERAELRAAIQNASAARQKLRGRENAVEMAHRHIDAAHGKLATTEAAIARAHETAAKRTASALAAGREPPTSDTMRAAREAETAARDEIAAAQAAHEQLKAEIAGMAGEVADAEHRVIVEVNKIMAGVLKAEFAEALRLQSALAVSKYKLSALIARDERTPVFTRSVAEYRAAQEREAALEIGDVVFRFLNVETPIDEPTRARARETAASWAAVRLTLRKNSEAELPPPAPF